MNYKDIYKENNFNMKRAAKSAEMKQSTFYLKCRDQIKEELGITVKEYKWGYIEPSKSVVHPGNCIRQKRMDINRVNNKKIREDARMYNALVEYNSKLIQTLENNEIQINKHAPLKVGKSVGILQISDTHFNEQVDTPQNKYNWDVASKRLRKHVLESMKYFKASGVNHVVVAMTGDLLNSDRRLDELTTNGTNRAEATVHAVYLLAQVLKEIYEEGFEVSYTFTCGNESRIGKDFGLTEITASDNFDYTIFHFLRMMLPKEIKAITPEQSSTSVLSIMGKNILLTHGTFIKRDPQKSINQIVSNYSKDRVNIDYVIFGHIHEAYISDGFARSGSLVGANDYSLQALNLQGRASQNCYIVNKTDIVGIKNDLQEYEGVEGYEVDEGLKAYTSKLPKANVIIQQVIV